MASAKFAKKRIQRALDTGVVDFGGGKSAQERREEVRVTVTICEAMTNIATYTTCPSRLVDSRNNT